MSLPYGGEQLQLNASVKGPLILTSKGQSDGLDSRFQCLVCPSRPDFAQSTSFKRHLRQHHCKVEGGSFVCLYGTNGVCASLPLEGVNAKDYEQHVLRQHLQTRIPSFPGVASMAEERSFAGAGYQSEEKWNIYSAVQNLPSALNDPKKGMTRDFFTRTWGETFVEVRQIPPHVALPQVLPRHVEGYGRRMRRRSRLMQSLQPSKPAPDDLRSPAAGESRAAGLASIPTLFFSPNFSLEDPVTFYSVFSHLAPAGCDKASPHLSPLQGGGTGGASGNSPPVTNIQEKLLQHLETVEGKMSAHIAQKSGAFFESMSHLSRHMDQLRCNEQLVLRLRDGICRLHQEAVVTPTRLLALPRRRNNILRTSRILEMMSAVRAVQSTIQVMLGRREFITALDLITTASQLITSDLTTIRSFRNISGELSEQVRIIEKMVSTDFIKYVSEDLNRPFDDDTPLLQQGQLIAVVFGVLRLNKMDFLDNLKEEVYAAINATVKQVVAERVSVSNTAAPDETCASVRPGSGEQAKHLPFCEWLDLLRHLTVCLTSLLHRHRAIVAVMEQAVEASAGRGQATAEMQAASIVHMTECGGVGGEWCDRVLKGLGESLRLAADFAHDRCAKLLHARSRDNGLSHMRVREFMTLSSIIETFSAATVSVCGRSSSPLKMALQGQCVAFVQRFHADREAKLRANLTNERWRAVPAPADLHQLAGTIHACDRLVAPADHSADPSRDAADHDSKPSSSHSTDDDAAQKEASRTSKDLSSSLHLLKARNDSLNVNKARNDSLNVSTSECATKMTKTESLTKLNSVAVSCASRGACEESFSLSDDQQESNGSTAASKTHSRTPSNAQDSKCGGVVLCGEEYVVVSVGVVVVRLVVEYAECATALNMAAHSLLANLADLLKRFNSETCRLLLEAGAVSGGSLRTINARHLALAHRCLQLVLALLPRLLQHFLLLGRAPTAEKTVAQLRREYEEHCTAIEVKMTGVAGVQVDRALGEWVARSPVPSPPMSSILKVVTRLHEAIVGVLTHRQVCAVFGRLTEALRETMRARLALLEVLPVGPQSWVVTSELTFYFNHLASLKVDLDCTQEQFSKRLWEKLTPS